MQPVAFQIGPIAIHWYGILLAIGFLVGLWTASRRGLRDGIDQERILDAGVWLIVGSVVGARLFFVIGYWEDSFAGQAWTEVFMVRKGGLVYYGGLIGASLAFVLYTRLRKLPLWKLADILAPSVSLGYAIGRPGCLMTGCCYGSPTELPWAIHYPTGHTVSPPGGPAQGVHPTQIYDALLALGFYAVLAWLYRRKKFDGQVFAVYIVGYSLLRIAVEFFRGDYTVRYLGGWATQAQLVSLACLPAGVILYLLLARKPARPA